jgi:hypothetical protein
MIRISGNKRENFGCSLKKLTGVERKKWDRPGFRTFPHSPGVPGLSGIRQAANALRYDE